MIRLRDWEIRLREGELEIVPKGVEHVPIAGDEVQVMCIAPEFTVNTGSVQSDGTIAD